uniref:Virginiamycin B lyase n=1 Tax=uncultured bacterium 3 TaxID=1748275 RepID=A0A0U3BBA8_9BACT|nr:membrane protein [uncultured bacterium 3]
MNPPNRRQALATLGALAFAGGATSARAQAARLQSWPLNTPSRTGIHDVAPAPDGGVWFTAQRSGHLGWFDPKTGRSELIALGRGSSPHGVIQGPDKAAWITDSGQNAIVRVAWPERSVRVFALPDGSDNANLNTCAFDGDGDLWFTGQRGVVGKVALKTGTVTVKEAPRGRGPYGICATPAGEVWWCSLAGSFIARIDRKTRDSTVVAPPTKDQGARRVWSDSHGRIWVSEWNSGQLSVHDPAARTPAQAWRMWKLPGDAPRCYAVYVDQRDIVWSSDFGGNAVFRFDPSTERFERFGFPREAVGIRQILGRPGEVWLPESGTEHISVIRTA